jgi:hypothetical protein
MNLGDVMLHKMSQSQEDKEGNHWQVLGADREGRQALFNRYSFQFARGKVLEICFTRREYSGLLNYTLKKS